MQHQLWLERDLQRRQLRVLDRVQELRRDVHPEQPVLHVGRLWFEPELLGWLVRVLEWLQAVQRELHPKLELLLEL